MRLYKQQGGRIKWGSIQHTPPRTRKGRNTLTAVTLLKVSYFLKVNLLEGGTSGRMII